MIYKVSAHCLECDSEHVSKLNVTTIWDFPLQHWVYNELSHPSHIFRCRDCNAESKELLWREETDVLGDALIDWRGRSIDLSKTVKPWRTVTNRSSSGARTTSIVRMKNSGET